MSTGLGLKGTTGRCFFHFQDFTVCMRNDDKPIKSCSVLRDDYLECLHQVKQKFRNKGIDAEEERQAKAASGGGGHGGHGGH